ncbi:hypothetical protein Nepgr_029389 [Nepenthes gracilis]|uniref:Uncharacterized protein n=1 Tax=Nepenthes gracilis TaxID=150966 RepID=A0AAD3TEU1_NEPGR|nr:hypothetical protein Nepgr_029389 [Nepenthes gracilis]
MPEVGETGRLAADVGSNGQWVSVEAGGSQWTKSLEESGTAGRVLRRLLATNRSGSAGNDCGFTRGKHRAVRTGWRAQYDERRATVTGALMISRISDQR